MGWRLEDSVFVSVLKSLPSGPDACADFIFRACTKQRTQISAKYAECLVYYAQQHANAMPLAISVTTVEE